MTMVGAAQPVTLYQTGDDVEGGHDEFYRSHHTLTCIKPNTYHVFQGRLSTIYSMLLTLPTVPSKVETIQLKTAFIPILMEADTKV